MTKFQITVIFGTRPEAIKMAPIVLALKANPKVDCRVCVTAQHRQMLDQVLTAFDIVPDADLNLMQQNQTLGSLTSNAIAALDKYLTVNKPELVLVQGDTTTVLCATLAAFYHRIPVGHVEAGLRTGSMQSPWPEEANRVLSSRLASLHFAPTETGRSNLLKEGTPDNTIFVTGNTVIDALLFALEKVRKSPPEIPGLSTATIKAWGDAPLVLITGHRRENFGAGFESICRSIATLAQEFPQTQFVYPVHLNPSVREPVERILRPASKGGHGNIHLIDPLPYMAFVWMMNRATMILTDSGGVQEEAPSLGKPVLVMRDTTERPEAVAAGAARLVGTDMQAIVSETRRLLSDPAAYDKMARSINPYGDGHATARIEKACLDFLKTRRSGE
jgi:UDP-N-acetylglucosamine 2-epimerase (non-hydrolysing)